MKKHALLVGVNHCGEKSGFKPLEYAEADATILGKALQELFGFNVQVLTNKDATKEKFESILTSRHINDQPLEPDDVFLLFFAGHGSDFGGHKYYLHLHGAEPDNLAKSYSVFEMLGFLNSAVFPPRRSLVVLDACRTIPPPPGYRGKADEATRAAVVLRRDVNNALRAGEDAVRHIGVLYGCEEGQVSQEDSKELKHGLLTWHLLNTLKSYPIQTLKDWADETCNACFAWSVQAKSRGLRIEAQRPVPYMTVYLRDVVLRSCVTASDDQSGDMLIHESTQTVETSLPPDAMADSISADNIPVHEQLDETLRTVDGSQQKEISCDENHTLGGIEESQQSQKEVCLRDEVHVVELLDELTVLTSPRSYDYLVEENNKIFLKIFEERALWECNAFNGVFINFEVFAELYLGYRGFKLPVGAGAFVRRWFEDLKYDVWWENGLGPHNEDELVDPAVEVDYAMRQRDVLKLLVLLNCAFRAHVVAIRRDAFIDRLEREKPEVKLAVYKGWAARIGPKADWSKVCSKSVAAFQVLQDISKRDEEFCDKYGKADE